ncbi:MAG: hypothetical protein ACI9VM_000370 [Candidatus Azotimanducaceae bacterium]|jgi:hypothetical protein
MDFFRFIFSFLYTRNWHSGEHELSRPRIVLFSCMFFLIFLALIIAAFLQAPVNYSV